jgi:hypothetical protein
LGRALGILPFIARISVIRNRVAKKFDLTNFLQVRRIRCE